MISLDFVGGAWAVRGTLLALALSACASSEPETETPRGTPSEGEPTKRDASVPTATRDAGDAVKGRDGGGLADVPVSADAAACAANLPFKPAGCTCDTAGERLPCWTGKPGDRKRGSCRDGVQTCVQEGAGEFTSSKWSACEGEVTECGEPAVPDEECGCVPGTTIACDEDCATLVICTLTGAKTCQPDGTWGPCREQIWTGSVNLEVVAGCRNFFHGCIPFVSEEPFPGIFVGDCSKAFECGHVPGLPGPEAPPPPATVE
ncbi:MAG: hypothetical protein ABW252_20595 [Polyangiales bacterium]